MKRQFQPSIRNPVERDKSYKAIYPHHNMSYINSAAPLHDNLYTGGFAPGIIAAAAGLNERAKKVKPATLAQAALEKKYGEKHKNNFLYKAAHGVLGIGKMLGYGEEATGGRRKKRAGKKKGGRKKK